MRFIRDEISRRRREREMGRKKKGKKRRGRDEMIELKGKTERWRERWKQPLARKWLPPVAIDR